MKILVTGGTGFLGAHLTAELLGQGHQVRVLARSKPSHAPPQLEVLQADLKDRDAVRRAIAGVDAVYHLAGLVSFKNEDGRKMYELHVDCTRDLLREIATLGTKPRFVLASTSGTIAVSKTAEVKDESADYPLEVVGRWPYYLSKIYEEKLALAFTREKQIPCVVLNPSLLLGPGDDRLSSTWTVSKFLQGDIPSMPNGGLSFVDVRDAAKAFAAALTRGEPYGRHLLGVNMTLAEMYERLERLTGVRAPRLSLPKRATIFGANLLEGLARARKMRPTLDPQEVEIGEHFFYLDASKAERELGFCARDPHQTLYDTVQYLLSRTPPDHLPGTKGRLYELRNR